MIEEMLKCLTLTVVVVGVPSLALATLFVAMVSILFSILNLMVLFNL